MTAAHQESRGARAPRRSGQGTSTASPLPVFDLGVAPYEPVQELQRRLRDHVADGRLPGLLLLLEHEPVITLGTRAGAHDLRASPPGAARPSITTVRSERGGQATLHAPGQLVSYPIVPIPTHDLSTYVHNLEEVLIIVLSRLDIDAVRHPGAPGLYVAEEKIASVGLRCRRWVASHGTSLNVSIDLSLFGLIVSCGDPDLRQTSILALTGRSYPMDEMKTAYVEAARTVFGWQFAPVQKVPHDRLEDHLGLETEPLS